MAPNAEIRQRIKSSTTVGSSSSAHQQQQDELTAPSDRLIPLSKLGRNEVCIDGIVYDLVGFDHPGGESIGIFGGNDVTIQYRMIHPYHSTKHLEKMKRVGKVADYTTEYKFDTPFEREVKDEVFKIVRRGKEFGTLGWYFRAMCYVTFYFSCMYFWIAYGSSWQLAMIYGVSQALIGLNVQHDANHGASSKRPWINHMFGLGADFIGGSKWLWMEQHWTHHSYTNHGDKDPDAFGAEPFFLFHNRPMDHAARAWIHRFQVYFYLPVLSGYWLSSVFNPEIFDLKQRGALTTGMNMESDYVRKSRKYAIFLRLMYIFIHCVVPFMHQGLAWGPFGDFMLLGATSGFSLGILFSLSHNFDGSDRDPIMEFRKTGEPVCWFKSQVETSSTYGGFISGCLTGGLNFQVEHHLFPRMSSAWYPFIAPKVREVCAKHGVKYAYYPWIWQNLRSTVTYMNDVGTGNLWLKNPLSGNL